ncbi:MAG TPA: efflux RND transporter permease subunit, partial [Acetobacteraceae bacterium]|nr:efflux RND transporter permease subunit [Acetobacteraceae bacterium]
MSISTPFIRRPIGTSLVIAALVLVGIAAYPFLPVAPLPRVDFPTILVNAKFPGASPETMASTVAQPLEREFAQIPGVAQMTSVSVNGQSEIVLQFDLDRNIDAAAGDIQARINSASGQLPKNLPSAPHYWKINPSDSPILIMSVQSDELPLIQVDDYADSILSQQISQIAGVGQVFIGGEQKRAIRVQVDPAKLAAMGLTLEDVRFALVDATVSAPKGTVDGPHRAFTIYDNDQLSEPSQFDNVILAYKNGAPVRVRDIGRAIAGPENNTLASWQNGKRGIILVIFKQPGANVIDTVERIKRELPRLEAALPPSVHAQILMDRTLTIRAAVTDVQFTLMLAVCLVTMVIFLFLRSVWATVIPAITVPVALICTFAAMFLLGFSLDNLSLMALTVAVGFVVDDAIVMLENIYRHVEAGMKPMDAALKGAGEIGFTIVSMSLSLVAVFIPLLLMGGIVGRLFREFAMTVAIAVLVSAFVSLTLTPMMCSRFLRHDDGGHGLAYRVIERFFVGLQAFYRRTLDIALRHSFITLLTFLATVSLTVVLYIEIPKGFFPAQDTGVVLGVSEGAQDVSFQQMSRIQAKLDAIIAADPDVAAYGATVGTGIGGETVNNGRIYIALKPWDQRVGGSAQDFINRIRPKLAAVQGGQLFLQASQDIRVGGRLSKTQYQYTLQDADLPELYQWAPQVLARLQQLPMLRDVTTDQQMSGMTTTLTIDRDQASRFGITPQAIDDTLYDAFGQRQVTQFFTQVNSYHVVLEVLPGLASDVATLNKLYVRAANGSVVPLSAFTKWTTEPVQPLSVSHQGQFPAVTISFNLANGASLGQAVDAIDAAMNQMRVPLAVQ